MWKDSDFVTLEPMETREAITSEPRAQQRLVVLTHILAGELDRNEAADALGLSVRQVRRLLERYRADGRWRSPTATVTASRRTGSPS